MDGPSESLYNARQQLVVALGDKEKQYFAYMKLWFRMVYTKEEFDCKARQLLEPHQIHCHNRFMVCLLKKCQSLADEPVRREPVMKSTTKDLNSASYVTITPECLEEKFKKFKEKYKIEVDNKIAFEPIDFLEIPNVTQNLSRSPLGEATHRLCSQDAFLPDQSLIFSRMLLGAWDVGLKGVEDLAAECLATAVQLFLKNIISTMISQKKGFQVRDKQVIHSLGHPTPDPSVAKAKLYFQMLKQNVKKDCEELNRYYATEGQDEVDKDKKSQEKERFTYDDLLHDKMSSECGGTASTPGVITPFDLRDTLKRYPSLIRSPKIYAISMQRVMLATRHLSHEELAVMRVLQNQDEDYVEAAF